MSTVTTDTTLGEDPHAGAHGDERRHDGDYIKVALILGFITALEVGVYYLDTTTTALVLTLLPMMAVKFGMVAWFFMHLKQDSRIFTRLFVTGIVLAVTVYSIVMLTFDELF